MKDIIIDKLKENTSLTIMEINDLLGLTSIEEYQSLENALDSLVSDGILYYSEKKKKYLLLENSHLVKGNLILNDKGFGFINIGKDSKDVYVSRDNINGAIDGDLVLFEYLNKDPLKPEGKIIRVIKRNYDPLVGEVILIDGDYFVKPDKKGKNIYIPRDYLNGAVEGHKVVVEPLKEGNRVGKITKIIGHKNDVGVDVEAIVYKHMFSPKFPDEVLEELKDITTGSKLEKLDDEQLESAFLEILLYSTIGLIMSRCGLDVNDYIPKGNFSGIEKFNTFETMSILGTATRDFSKEILLEVSKAVINVQKQEKKKNHTFEKVKQSIYNKENEKGSVKNESNLHTKRELSNTKLNDRENKQESESRQVRQNEIEVSKREQEGNLHNATSEQQTNATPNDNTGNSSKQNSTGSREDETTIWNNRGNESNQPDGMDRTYEQYSSNSRTDSNKGTNLQLKEQDNQKEVDNTSFFDREIRNTDNYKFIVGDIIYIGFQEFTISNIDNQTITMYDNQFPLDQRTVAINDILEKVAENPMNDYLKDREVPEVEEKVESAFNKWLDTFIEEKGIDISETFKSSKKGISMDFSYENVLVNIKSTSENEQEAIKEMLIKIDFYNGDIKEYLRHLSKALIPSPEEVQRMEEIYGESINLKIEEENEESI